MGNERTNGLSARDYFDRVTNFTAFEDELNAIALKKLRSERKDFDARTEGRHGASFCDYSNFPYKPYKW